MANFATKDINATLIISGKEDYRRGKFVGWVFILQDSNGKKYSLKLTSSELASRASNSAIKTALTTKLGSVEMDARTHKRTERVEKSIIAGKTIGALR